MTYSRYDLVFPNELRRLRERAKLTQAELGKQTGYREETIARFENGEAVPSEWDLSAIAKALDLAPWEESDLAGSNSHFASDNKMLPRRRDYWGSIDPPTPRPQIAGHAFISYVREDAAQVDKLEIDLQAAGIKVWRDVQNIWPGQDWKREIRHAIENDSCAFIACFSEHSRARTQTYQWEELILAAECFRQRPPDKTWMYPVRLDDGPIVDFDLGAGRTLGSLQRTDLFGPNRDTKVTRLITSIKRSLGN